MNIAPGYEPEDREDLKQEVPRVGKLQRKESEARRREGRKPRRNRKEAKIIKDIQGPDVSLDRPHPICLELMLL